MGFLLEKRPGFLLGGFEREDVNASLLMRTFWENLRQSWPDHEVYQMHPDSLDKAIPFLLHLDEGTGLRKSSVLVVSAQCVWGRETSQRFYELYAGSSERSDEAVADMMSEAQMHNHKGSTYKTRYLFTLQPKKSYTGMVVQQNEN